MSEIVFLNHEFIDISQANISITDRGFLFGDGIYEVIPVYQQNMFRFDAHMQRLQQSLAAVNINCTLKPNDWQVILNKLIANANNPQEDHSIYIQITRGSAPQRSHYLQNDLTPTIFARCSPSPLPSIETLRQGANVITHQDCRWDWCYIKSINLLPNTLLCQLAYSQGAKEAILIRDGNAIECTSSNLFIVKNNIIITPPKSKNILGGITRDFILELATQQQLPFAEQDIALAELYQADEIWFTGSTKSIVPATKIDDRIIGNGNVGPVWETMIKHYYAAIAKLKS